MTLTLAHELGHGYPGECDSLRLIVNHIETFLASPTSVEEWPEELAPDGERMGRTLFYHTHSGGKVGRG